MNARELEINLRELIKNKIKLAVMIWGPPGIGKSATVCAIAKSNDLKLVDLRLSQLAPTDLRGLPVADREKLISNWYPPEFLPNDGNGILFLDELNTAPPAMQGIAQQLILDRRVGDYCLPDGWFVWAAGNRQEDASAVFKMPSALQNRFIHFDVESDFDSFRTWALENDINEQILAFLAWRPNLLHKFDRAEAAWPSPRSWAAANELHNVGLNVSSAIGIAASMEFITWLDIYKKIPDLDLIISGDGKGIKFPKEPSLRYATTIGLAVRANNSNYIKNSFEWLAGIAGPEWIQLFLHSKVDLAAKEGTVGVIAKMISANKQVKKYIDAYRDFLAQM